MNDSMQTAAVFNSAIAETAPAAPGAARPAIGGSRGTPLWSRIEGVLAQRISTGALAPGTRLPPAHVLAGEFGVNRHTMRQAIAALGAKGLVRVRHGHGTFVCDLALEYVLGTRTRLSENLLHAGIQGVHRMLGSDVSPATSAAAARLGVAPGSALLRIVSVAEARGLPISTGEHWFPAERFSGLDVEFARTGSITRALVHYGITDYTRRENLITAQLPDEHVAQILRQSPVRPVLCVESVNIDTRGTAIEFGRAWFAGDLIQLLVKPD